MAAIPIRDLFELSPRYLRSTNLERDFRDKRALENYVFTGHAHECLDRLAKGLQPGSTQRAWRLTGNYGSGKSSFALFLAHWFGGEAKQLSRAVNADVEYKRFALGYRPRYLPLLITGAREPLGRAIVRAAADLLDEQYQRGMKSGLQVRLRAAERKDRIADDDVLEMLSEANDKLARDGRSTGLLILLDELGKFLEFAAHNPQQQDVFLLQRLAELAAAADKSAPMFVVGMLHQGFDAYAENLDPSTQREWEKVAGRFEEVVFNQPLLQVSELIAAALRVNLKRLPSAAREEAKGGWDAAANLHWLGTGASEDLAPRLYPLHATIVPAMVLTFARFGQNERSLFSFLLAEEPFGLMSHARRNAGPGASYRLHHFYDYVRATFGYRLSAQSYRSHWTQIESMVESFATADPVELAVVKTVGLLNLLDHPDLVPTEEALQAALGGLGGFSAIEIKEALARLYERRKVLFRRGSSAGFRLWPHTSVDLEAAYERATQAVGPITSVARHLVNILESRSLVARRHYIETGNLRFFDVRYLQVDQLGAALQESSHADGAVAVVLCESQSDRARAEKVARSQELKLRPDVLLAIPEEPLSHQAGLVAEVLRWEWVSLNTPELNADRFARDEVTRQLQAARMRLQNRVQDLIGLQSLAGARSLHWYVAGASQRIADGRQLLQRLSSLCDERYPQAPLVKHELLNRHSLSSAAARARYLLVSGMLQRSDQPYLGMDSSKKPPEMSMYMSVLQRGNVHIAAGGRHQLRVPIAKADPLRLRPSLEALRAYLDSRQDRRVSAKELLQVLERPPFGVRSGLAGLLLGVFTSINAQELAFYEDGTFLRELGPDEFNRLLKVPHSFEVQLCRVAGLRAEVFDALLRVLDLRASSAPEPMVLDVVRPLCQFVAKLPDYARSTKGLSDAALRIREAILTARDPVKLLFKALPEALGIEGIAPTAAGDDGKARQYAKALKRHVDELRHCYDALLQRIAAALNDELACGEDFTKLRPNLAKRAETLMLLATEPQLKALCLRFADTGLGNNAWLESIASFLTSQPPARWRDVDESAFRSELSRLAATFKSLESLAFAKTPDSGSAAYKLSVTRSSGHEAGEVVFLDASKAAEVSAIAEKIAQALGKNRNVALAALCRAAWAALEQK